MSIEKRTFEQQAAVQAAAREIADQALVATLLQQVSGGQIDLLQQLVTAAVHRVRRMESDEQTRETGEAARIMLMKLFDSLAEEIQPKSQLSGGFQRSVK
ncbi:hypothetical protein [Cupriavidus basilensis]|uniref:hypothetical protein n=1 Tax=Cupriavidus basilensis TaxID=68895 RepID=UPI0020A63305|nr:hypothetical protein [Cupriavidus basilensis]MCP3017529.1 hypothetical protein [Cupriavidus basilensis]